MDEDLRLSIEHNMTNHAPAGVHVVKRFEDLREPAKAFAMAIAELAPASRERSLALTKLEEALMWSIAAVARNQDAIPDDV